MDVLAQETSDEELMRQAAAEVDLGLIEWFSQLSLVERLRATSRNAATLERLARGAARDG